MISVGDKVIISHSGEVVLVVHISVQHPQAAPAYFVTTNFDYKGDWSRCRWYQSGELRPWSGLDEVFLHV